MSLDMSHVRSAPGQAVKPCPRCGQALVDTGDQVWAHAIGVEPCGEAAQMIARYEQNGYLVQ